MRDTQVSSTNIEASNYSCNLDGEIKKRLVANLKSTHDFPATESTNGKSLNYTQHPGLLIKKNTITPKHKNEILIFQNLGEGSSLGAAKNLSMC